MGQFGGRRREGSEENGVVVGHAGVVEEGGCGWVARVLQGELFH